MTWRDRAQCRDRIRPDCDLSDRRPRQSKADAAGEYCRGCPVLYACALDALNRGDVGVVRAGIFLQQTTGGQLAARARRALEDLVDSLTDQADQWPKGVAA